MIGGKFCLKKVPTVLESTTVVNPFARRQGGCEIPSSKGHDKTAAREKINAFN